MLDERQAPGARQAADVDVLARCVELEAEAQRVAEEKACDASDARSRFETAQARMKELKASLEDLLTTESQCYVDKTNVYRWSWKHPICCI